LPSYTYDRYEMAFKSGTNRPVTKTEVAAVLDDIEASVRDQMAVATAEYAQGIIDIEDWHRTAQDIVTSGHMSAAALAGGGFNQLPGGTANKVKGWIQDQHKYLEDFREALSIQSGEEELSHPYNLNRALMYGGAVRTTFAGVQTGQMEALWHDEVSNKLGPADHCPECRGLTAKGYIPIPEMPAPGLRVCLTNCQCHLVYRQSPDTKKFLKRQGSKLKAIAGGGDVRKLIEDMETAKLAFSGTHAGLTADVHTARVIGDKVKVVGTIRTADDKWAGEFERLVDNKTMSVYHKLLQLDPSVQGSGFAAAFNAQAMQYYRQAGYKQVTLHADIDVGGYAWARQGFNFRDPSTQDSFTAGQQKEAIGRVGLRLKGWKPSKELTDSILSLTGKKADAVLKRIEEVQAQMQAFNERLIGDYKDWPSAHEISEIGKDITWTIKLGDRDVQMWPGKAVLLNSEWYGQMPLQAEPAPKPKPAVEFKKISTKAAAREVYEGTFGDFKVKVTEFDAVEPGKLHGVSGVIIDTVTGDEVGQWDRYIDHVSKTIRHEFFQLDSDVQGTGLAAKWNKQAFEAYKAAGYEQVVLHANINVGGYAWARQGFKFDEYNDLIDPLPSRTSAFIQERREKRKKEEKTQAENMKILRDKLQGLVFHKDKKVSVPAKKYAKQIVAWLDGDSPDLPDAFEVSELGKHLAEDYELPSGEMTKMWPGKEMMLGIEWFGRMALR
jgi:GNAT superfamily N-acetyltransferase